MNHVTIENQAIPYEERRSTRYRRITLSMFEDRLRVSAPKYVSAKQLQDVIVSKREWILKNWLIKQDKLKEPVEFVDGEHFLYKGNTLQLKVIKYPHKMPRVFREGQVLKVYLPQGLPEEDRNANIKAALLVWYKAQARKVLLDKLEMHAKKMKVVFHMVRLKEQKTIWGSCSSKGNLNLNWRIIMAPEAAMDYIIIHELSHLTHLNHSKEFWERVGEFMPDYKHWRKWFKDHGQELTF
ncbi:putative metal-dependent hydrolase [Desulfosporosinus orientis DSM 765]|uniref:Putative metal-dependent hydrolase n=1 Tax=Desulfosporosinus orientis (strain ATCC 19365 / DSM 765 / NCIMB 8382 / VKM B-1628 / Singapore I) TaxID=768706 RepID=G7WAS6_DESOD|nr:SprT family zinc-dependent metalloprotease [Desulfosporosinus orientis]AET67137.1 putative metal-dependent hydrolase [Desulfosporosinus orientis DSM 765]